MSNVLEQRYKMRLATMPAPGCGNHRAQLAIANLGVMIGLNDHEIFTDMRQAIPPGGRRIPDSELQKTITRARREVTPASDRPTDWKPPAAPKRAVRGDYGKQQRAKYIERGAGFGEADFFDLSPVKLPYRSDDGYTRDAVTTLEQLYAPGEHVFIGTNYAKGEAVKTAAEWLDLLTGGAVDLGKAPHVIPNPLTGQQAPTHDGKQSYRADNCVADRRYAVVEFDDLPRDDQFAFWAGIPLPVVAIIDSGGKSLHAWLRVDCSSADAWQTDIKDKLYRQVLEPLGVDPACKNPARLSRLPGRYRPEKCNWQRLLYLDPEGGPIC